MNKRDYTRSQDYPIYRRLMDDPHIKEATWSGFWAKELYGVQLDLQGKIQIPSAQEEYLSVKRAGGVK